MSGLPTALQPAGRMRYMSGDRPVARPRVLSGIQPTGAGYHVGSWVGAVRNWTLLQESYDAFYCVVDLHAITLPQDPTLLRRRTRESIAELIALGVDPERCTLFVQSHVPEHPQLTWVLGCLTGFGEASRMTQFKDKSARSGAGGPSVGLFTYPILQAADILLYQADQVPVGDDQRQHLELTRDLARRFNSRFGPTLTVPSAYVPAVGARILDLQDPGQKMSKSLPPAGTLYLQDDPAVLRKKVRSAVTDTGREIVARADKPGIGNLLSIYSALSGHSVSKLEADYAGQGYGDLKTGLADVVAGFVRPFQERYRALLADPGWLDDVLAAGAAMARTVAARTLAEVYDRVGFLPPIPLDGSP